MAGALIGGARHVDRLLQRLGETLEAGVEAARLGQLVEPALGVLDLVARRHVDRRLVGDVDHVLADGDQVAPDREVIDGAAVILRVDDRRRLVGEAGEIFGDGDLADLLVLLEEALDRARIGGLVEPDELRGLLEDLPMQRIEEMRRLEEIGDAVERFVVDQDGAEQRLLDLDVVRDLTVKRLVVGRQDLGKRHRFFSLLLRHPS